MGRKIVIEKGEKFGKLTVLGESSFKGRERIFYDVVCACGDKSSVRASELQARRSHRCKRCSVTKHGFSKHPLYDTYLGMIYRCYNPKAKGFHRYGMRGITVYEKWRYDFLAFVDYVESNLGPRPDGKRMDRINNKQGYYPGNIRWASFKENNNNRECSKKNRKDKGKFILVPIEYVKKSYFIGIKNSISLVKTVPGQYSIMDML